MTADPISKSWFAEPLEQVLTALNADPQGLSVEEARRRLQALGPNRLPQAPPPQWWEIVLRQFQGPLIYILLIAALVSALLGEWTDAGFIAAVLCLNALIGTIQEIKAEQSAQALQKLLQIRATVERAGETHEINAEEVVPGDLVWLESGNRVPADLRLLGTHNFEIDESLLTGESLAVVKNAQWQGTGPASVGDRLNMAHAGSVVIRGRGRGLVVATGIETEVGRLAGALLGMDQGKPPLIHRMELFSKKVALATLGVVIVVALIGILGRGYGVIEMFMFGVALAVSAIPEGLPVALTVALSIGTTRMAQRGVIVRRLAAVEGLGSCTLIASDKTGTLTCNELTVREVRLPNGIIFDVTGQGYQPEGVVRKKFGDSLIAGENLGLQSLATAAVLCNEADLHHKNGTWVWRGDPTDIALLSFGHKAGMEHESLLGRYPQINQIPFEPEYRFSATFHAMEEGNRVFVKGSPERVFQMCVECLDEKRRTDYQGMAEEMARQGYRVLAFAEGPAPEDLNLEHSPPEPSGLRLLGLAGMIDPPRAGVREAIAACREAGVQVAMVTGDHPVTALAIALDLGIDVTPEQVVVGTVLEKLSSDELTELVQKTRVFARVAPRQKLDLVNAMRAAGHFVAVTGDGVNDAPALRAANIGVAMGKSGTDVAREAAELVISDDNFATIVAGIEEGRIAYDNIRKVIYLLVSTGAAEVILVTLAVGFGMPLPLLPAQLLWLNLVTNGIQDVALAFEPGERGVLKRRPRSPKESIFNRLMVERTLVGALVIGLVGFAAFRWFLQSGMTEEAARNALLLLMVLFENVHVANCRSETKSAFKISVLRSPVLLFGVVTAFLVHLAAMYLPLGQEVLRTEPVDGNVWLVLIGFSLSILAAMEIHKWTWAKRRGGAR